MMKLGMFTCGYQRTSLKKAFADAKAFGYDYVELWGGRPHAYGPDLIRKDSGLLSCIRDLIQAYEMPVRIYTPEHNAYPFNYMLGDEHAWEDSMNYLRCCMEAGKLLGAEAMLVSIGHGGDVPVAERRRRLVKSLEVLSSSARDFEISLLVETLTRYESNTCTSLEELVQLLNELDRDNLLGMCDLAVPFTNGEDPADYVRRLGRRMGHLHLTDNDGVSDIHLIPGEGKIPFRETLRHIREAGYDGTATIELVTNYLDAPAEAAEKAIRAVREAIRDEP